MQKLRNYWIGVIGNLEMVTNLSDHLWWCLPIKALKTDRIFMYCPRSLNINKHGIFAECELISDPYERKDENYRCSGFGRAPGQYGYTELRLIAQFQNPLTARELKRDPILKTQGFVRKNFQGTVFHISPEGSQRMLTLVKDKNIE